MHLHSEGEPTAVTQRIRTLDVLRGFAIFGIFMVNVEIMNCVFKNADSFGAQWTGSIDAVAIRIQQLFFYTKFFPIFSLLFGIGISIQFLNMERKGLSRLFFYRRMAALFIFGVCHILFVWSGDVIHLYAVLGLLTFSLVRLKSNYLIAISIALLVFPFGGYLFEGIIQVTGYDPVAMLEGYPSDKIVETIRHGSYIEGLLLRMHEYGSNAAVLFVFLMPVALAMFILGLVIGKKGYLQDLPKWARKIRKPVLIIAVVSNIYRLIFLFALWDLDIWKDPFWRELFIYLMKISDTLMGLFYVWLIVYAMQYSFWKKLLLPLQYVGRMALTNYLLQSLIGLLLFSSLGFQWYETLSPYQTILVAVLVFALQVIMSALWLRYFRFGPMEWLWRCISYWKILSLRKAS
jgi:uncharacterized protein